MTYGICQCAVEIVEGGLIINAATLSCFIFISLKMLNVYRLKGVKIALGFWELDGVGSVDHIPSAD